MAWIEILIPGAEALWAPRVPVFAIPDLHGLPDP